MIKDIAGLWILDRICSVTWALRNKPNWIMDVWIYISNPLYEKVEHYMFIDEMKQEDISEVR